MCGHQCAPPIATQILRSDLPARLLLLLRFPVGVHDDEAPFVDQLACSGLAASPVAAALFS